jgi:hypothetical protein
VFDPQRLEIRLASSRVTVSAELPPPQGTMIRTGRESVASVAIRTARAIAKAWLNGMCIVFFASFWIKVAFQFEP